MSENNPSIKDVKSKYILLKIFGMMQNKRSLNIIRYNKKFQEKLEKNINHYIKEYSKIEIEIFPVEKKYGKFSNISSIKRYHIYFNDNSKEAKRD